MRYILFVSVALGIVLLYLLSLASANTAASGDYYKILLYLNITLAGVLVILIGVQLWLLAKKIKSRVMGSRLTLRLLGTFALMAIIPGLIVYLVSVNFLTRSIESWFNVKVESALDGGLSLGQRALDIMLADVEEKAENIATSLAFQPTRSHYSLLNDLREKSGIQDATLLTPQGRILSVSSSDPNSFLPELPSIPQLRQAQSRVYGKIEPIPNKGLYLRVLAPVNVQEIAGETRILQLLQPVPKSLSNTAEAVQEVYRDYQELSYSRNSLKDIFALTLTLVLMLAMLSALAIAFVLSRRLTQPLTVLAEGTRAIASGDYSTMLPEHGKDELGILVKSFNSMTRQLGDATRATERNRARVEAARGYLETILAHLSSGVLAINEKAELRTYNVAASNILGVSLTPFENKPFAKIAESQTFLAEFIQLLQSHFEITKAKEQEKQELTRQIEIVRPQGKQLLLVRATRLPDSAGSGFVVVFDDVTTMVQAQRDAAWGEVARRLAHEIKNPLTPIQLSAERLQHKLHAKLNEEDASVLQRATDTIVNQVSAMKSMVNEFSEYARAPSATLIKLNLNRLIKDVSALYEGAREDSAHARIIFSLAPDMPDMKGDATMLRQVLHNLMQNAQDALMHTENPEILVQTKFDETSIQLVVKDNGQGFPLDLLSHAFEPYVTTKAHGTGLGLAIVKKMIEEHSGQIKIENNPTGGACITIVLPIERSVDKNEAKMNNENNVKGAKKQATQKPATNNRNKQKMVREV
ncbi:MAG TPA: ATP-binding protein [Methylotenera sp.]|nr:ATP-binding protein [Methylotenera sp.]HPV44833.1 ATP-binding protein [Methylotenera sp.]